MMKAKTQEIHLRGMPICRGIAIGKPFFFAFVEDDTPEFSIPFNELEDEVLRYRRALARSKEDVIRLMKQLEGERIMEGAAILDSHQQMMQDPLLTFEVEKLIRATRKNAEYAFQKVIKQCQKKFSSMADPFFRERFKDIQDISRRVMGYLRESVSFTLADIPADAIIFAREFTPSDIAEAGNSAAGALISNSGSTTSHSAIVARAKGIPFVSNVNFEGLDLADDAVVIVDGRTGEIIVNPSPATLMHYRTMCDKLRLQLHKMSEAGKLEAETYDGYKIRLSANIDVAPETELLHEYGGSGVGLFRSETVFLTHDTFPSEDEQFEIYRRIVEKMHGLPIVIRTFDIGGDKQLSDRKTPIEGNPYLGCRAIRFMLKEHAIFKTQLRAILRASAYGDVSIMFPMISTLSELRDAKVLLSEARDELRANKVPFGHKIRVGCMIEVPSAAIISDLLARECDFLSIGTNDLVQYALAVDRDNHALNNLYSPTHPSVIRLIRLVVTEANLHNIPVTVCGEVAADPRFTPLLLGLGVHELSVASRYLPIVKNAIRNTSIVAASKLAEEVMLLTTSQEIEELLNEQYRQNVPEDCFYN